jgi:N6-adenosine-specific RNA methylase IME4
MSLAELAGLAVGPELAADTAVLGLWVPAGLNRVGVGVELAEAWGFAVVGEMIWAKPNLGMGAVPRTSHEVLLIATRGAGALAGAPRGIHSVQTWGQTYGRGKAHSRKPSGALDLAERLSPGPYLELFARQGRLGWDTWGYGVEARHPVPDTGGINRGGSPGQGTNPGG